MDKVQGESAAGVARNATNPKYREIKSLRSYTFFSLDGHLPWPAIIVAFIQWLN